MTVFLFAWLLACLPTAISQDLPIDELRAFPPTHISKPKLADTQIQWRLKHLTTTREQQQQRHQALLQQLSDNRGKVKSLTSSLPEELRAANDQIRTDVLSICLRELFAARLDAASHGEMIKQLESQLAQEQKQFDEIEQLTRRRFEVRRDTIAMKLALARKEFEHVERLFKKGNLSQQEYDRAKYDLQMAQYEMSQAEIEFEIDKAARAKDISQRLSDARIDMQPVQARVAAAEEFLQMFASSKKIMNQINELDREYDTLQPSLQASHETLWKLDDQIAELEALRKIAQSELENQKNPPPSVNSEDNASPSPDRDK